MKLFIQNQVREALEHAQAGGQALHVYAAIAGMDAPACFRASQQWAHLFDYDRERLVQTARQLGVRVVVVHHEGLRGQHVDLCGRPLQRAIAASDEAPNGRSARRR